MPLLHLAPSRQRGVTLVSLMVGLIISMIVILATLMLFQRMVRATTAARSDAQADAQRSAAFLGASIAVQEAGYRIDAPQAGSHLVVLANATLSGATLSGTPVQPGVTGNAVVWAENLIGTPRCSALLAPSAPDRGVLRKLGPVACANAAAFAGLAWTSLPLSDATAAPVTITWQATHCTPFGITASAGSNKVLLTLSAGNSNGVILETSTCLVNVSAP